MVDYNLAVCFGEGCILMCVPLATSRLFVASHISARAVIVRPPPARVVQTMRRRAPLTMQEFRTG
jgi:hypothetical protein